MFGMPAVKHRTGKAFAGLFDGAMVFKLDGPEHAEALGLAGASLIRSLGMGRPFAQWVQVPREHRHEWPRFAEAALRTTA